MTKTYDRLGTEYHELAARMFNLHEAVSDTEVESRLQEEFGLDWTDFANLVDRLLPLTPKILSPLTNTAFHALGYSDGEAWIAIVKIQTRQGASQAGGPE